MSYSRTFRSPFMLTRALLASIGVLAACSSPSRSLPPEAEERLAKRHHIVRFQAEVEFDGQPLVFDEFIECSPYSRPGTATQKAALGVYENRRWISKRLPDGGSVTATVHPFYCHEFQNLWDEKAPDRAAVNPLHLPLFEHRDKIDAPTRIEMYVSEAYYDKPHARLKIKNIKIAPATYPPTDADIAEARRQAATETFRYNRVEGDEWREARLVPVEEEIWGREPRLVEYFNRFQPGDGFIELDLDRDADPETDLQRNARERIGRITGRNGAELSPLAGGVPRIALSPQGARPGLHPDDYPKGVTGAWAGEVIPIDRRGGKCFADSSHTGFIILHYLEPREAQIWLCDTYEFDGRTVPLKTRSNFDFFYDPSARAAYRVAKSNGIFWN